MDGWQFSNDVKVGGIAAFSGYIFAKGSASLDLMRQEPTDQTGSVSYINHHFAYKYNTDQITSIPRISPRVMFCSMNQGKFQGPQ